MVVDCHPSSVDGDNGKCSDVTRASGSPDIGCSPSDSIDASEVLATTKG